ncbi:hypothetical protein GALMADRAFT_212209 [Galerina marginata CBS 339.88]|uniref:F-box domain-containing protein n=1 Tax=Galerina marginata (strain CBS 339.88) TaxID=685588 RepID=A0A067SSW9_GALM3|nr:hypothetical protein GALMADRAFT_212209 [Galerina marginata CBS 339.88]
MEAFTEGPPQAHIHKLHPDLLWLIFELNTALVRHASERSSPTPNITTARRTSQVCRSWRNILLASPSLWGRLIDLDTLNQPTDNWRNEIMRRAGSAYLWITGHILQLPTPSQTFFFSILTDRNCWNRIQRIVVDVQDIDPADSRWDALCYPAPSLEVFRMSFALANPDILPILHPHRTSNSAHYGSLFANNAPSLREFDARKIYFAPDVTWLSQLRHIFFPPWFPVSHVLKLLQKMPHLQSLQPPEFFQPLPGISPENHKVDPPHLHLPNITKFNIVATLDHCQAFMKHITPAPGCGFSFIPMGPPLSENSPLGMIDLHLAKHMHNYFKIHPPTALRFECSRGIVNLQLDEVSDLHYSEYAFLVYVFAWDGIPFDLFCLLLDSISSSQPYFTSLENLSLDLYRFTKPALYASLRSTLDAMASVTTLRTNGESVRVLLNLELSHAVNGGRSILFPALRTLQIIYIALGRVDQLNPKSGDADAILLFMRIRRQASIPTFKLDFSGYPSHPLRDITVEEELKGLGNRWVEESELVENICEEWVSSRRNICS